MYYVDALEANNRRVYNMIKVSRWCLRLFTGREW